jgi:hypothetical protein
MSKPVSAYGLLEVAKPGPMGQSDWPLRFETRRRIYGLGSSQNLAPARIARIAETEEHALDGHRAGQAGDVSG